MSITPLNPDHDMVELSLNVSPAAYYDTDVSCHERPRLPRPHPPDRRHRPAPRPAPRRSAETTNQSSVPPPA